MRVRDRIADVTDGFAATLQAAISRVEQERERLAARALPEVIEAETIEGDEDAPPPHGLSGDAPPLW